MAGPNRKDYEERGTQGNFEAPDDAVAGDYDPSISPIDTTEVTFEQLKERFAGTGNPYAQIDEDTFNRFAQGGQADDFRALAENHNQRAARQAERRLIADQKQQVQDQNVELERQIDSWNRGLEALGQGGDAANELADITDMAARLLALDGDSEEHQAAREQAAAVLAQYQRELKPHIEARLGEDWWLGNYERINEFLPEGGLDGWQPGDGAGEFFANFMANVGRVATSRPGDYLLDILSTTGESAALVGGGFRAALDRDDGVSATDALKFSGSTLLQMPKALAEAIAPGLGNDVADGERYLTTSDGQTLSFDLNDDGTVSFREMLGRSNELSERGQDFAEGLSTITGGALGEGATSRFVGAFDTAGLAAIDPASWVTLGSAGRARAGVNTLRSSSDSASQMAGRRLANGARFSELDEVAQTAARTSWMEAAEDAALRSRQYRRAERAGKEAGELRTVRDRMVTRQLDKIEDAVSRGSIPGIRVFGTTVVPMTRVYNAIGILDSHIARGSAWTQKVSQLVTSEGNEELVQFIHRFDGGAVPEAVKEEVRDWSGLTRAMADEEFTWLDDVLEASGGSPGSFDEIEAFGRSLLGDDAVAGWRARYDELYSPPQSPIRPSTTAPARDALTDARQALGEDTSTIPNRAARRAAGTPQEVTEVARIKRDIRAMVDEVDAAGPQTREATLPPSLQSLPQDAQDRIRANLDLVQRPAVWVSDDLGLRGLRGLYNRDTVAGRLYRRMANAISPRARVRNKELGQDAAQAFDDAANEADAIRRLAYEQADALGINAKRESRLAGLAEGEGADWERQIDRGLSGDSIESQMATLLDAGKTNTAQLLRVLDRIRDDILEMSVAAGADRSVLLARRGYMPRQQAAGAQEFADEVAGQSTQIDRALRQMGLIDTDDSVQQVATVGQAGRIEQRGFLRARSYKEDIESIFEVNEAARDDLIQAGLAPEVAGDFTLYTENPVTSMMMRSRAAQEARVYTDMLDAMADVTAPSGRPLGYRADTADDLASTKLKIRADDGQFGKSEYDRIPLPNGGAYFVDKRIREEIDRTRRIVGSTEKMGKVKELANAHNNIWAAYATVVNPAFHSRNALGNAFNMFLSGMNDPSRFASAFRIQRLQAKVASAMEEGASYDEAIGRVVDNTADERLIRDIRKYDLASSNRVTDLLNEYDPLNPDLGSRFLDSSPVRVGRSVGTAIEGNARIALYIDGVEKGMDPQQAARRVRQTLFDYADLTEFEAESLRTLSRFYTFTRKNTALQARVLSTTPGRIVNANRLTEEFTDNLMASVGFQRDESGELEVPDWMSNANAYTRGTGDDAVRLAVGADTPFGAFMDTSEQLSSLLLLPAWITNMAVGGDEARDNAGQRMRETLQLFSGGPVEAGKTATEVATGTDLFSGSSLNYQDRTVVDRFTRFTDLLFPVGSTIDRHLEGFGVYESAGLFQSPDEDGDGEPDFPDRVQGSHRLLNLMTGMQLYVDNGGDVSTMTPEMQTMLSEMDGALREAQKDVPRDERLSMDDLVDMGNVMARNDVYLHVLYTGRTPDNFTDEDFQWLDRNIPESIQKDLGIDVANDRGLQADSERTPAEAARLARERIAALKLAGVAVTPAMEDDILKYSLGLTINELEGDIGAEAYRTFNSYRDRRDEALGDSDPEAAAQANRDFVAEVLEIMGKGSLDEWVEDNPVVTRFDRKVADMRQAGFSEDEIATEIMENLSRERRAIIFGEESLDEEFSYESYTSDEIDKIQSKAQEAVSELDWTLMYQLGRRPTPSETEFYLGQVMFTSPEQDRVGIDRYSAPRRDNVTSDETYIERQTQEAGAIDDVVGTSFLDRLGQP